MRQIPILAGKSISKISQTLKRSGSTWPGHIALKIDSKIIQKILLSNPNLKLILIAGTNGKTTTAKFIQESLESQGLRVFRNAAGANLLNGIVSSLIHHSDMNGKINYDVAVFEIDENTLPLVISELSNVTCRMSLVLLNLFRDQLDRYGEVNTIAKNWALAIKQLNNSTILITNGDDPMLRFIGQESKLKTYYFGLSSKFMQKKEIMSDVDFLYCPNCDTKLEYSKRSYSHLGMYKCPKCKFENDKTENFPTLPSPMLGLYNRYNINAAATLLTKVFSLKEEQVQKIIEVFSPAFGRQEKIEYRGKGIFLLLSKNPTGFNQSIEAILEDYNNSSLREPKEQSNLIKDRFANARDDKGTYSSRLRSNNSGVHVLLLLNDRIPDGRDISWIWDIDLEQLVEKSSSITVSGDRTYDMGLRVKYAQEIQKSEFKIQNLNSKVKIEENLREALESAVNKIPENDTLYILATYSAMLDVRKILKGRSIL